LGWCVKNGGERSPYREPYYLRLPDGRKFRLDFDCKNCQMKVVKV
jgi:putative protease